MVNRILAMIARIERRVLLGGAAGLAAFLLAYALVGFLVLPGVVKSKAEQLVLDRLHRPLSIEKVEVNPFSLSVTLLGVRMQELDKTTEFASVERLYLNISTASMFRLAPVVQELKLIRPHLRLVRYENNRYNVDDLVALALAPKPDKEQARFSLYNIQVEGGRIEFDDQPKKTKHVVDDLKLGVPFVSSLPSQVDIFVEPLLSAHVNGTPLLVKGKTRPFAEQKDGAVDLQLEGIDLPRYMEYLPFEPRFRLPEGKLSVDLTFNLTQAKGSVPAALIEGGLSLKSLLLTELDGTPMLRLPELNVSGVKANLSSGQHRIGRIELVKPEVHLVKEAGGKFNLARLAPEATETSTIDKPSAASASVVGGSDIRIELDHLVIKDGSGSYQDEQSAQALKATADKLDLVIARAFIDLGKRAVGVEQISSAEALLTMAHGKPRDGRSIPPQATVKRGEKDNSETGFAYFLGKLVISGWTMRLEDQSHERPAVTLVSPIALTLTDLSSAPESKGAIEALATVNKGGILSAKGNIGLTPMQADLSLNLKDVDILAVQPYVADQINLVVKRANLSSTGMLQIARASNGELKGGFKGDASIGDLITVDRVSGNDFVRWKRFSLTGIDARLAPLSLTASQMALNNFFARVIINREGRINLQDVTRQGTGRQKSLTEEEEERTNTAEPAAAPEQIATAPEKAAGPPVTAPVTMVTPVRIGKFVMKNGRVRFTDNFIQPNYSASLSNLNGTISDLSSDASAAAAVDVRGQVSGAPLTIEGKVNPLSGNLFLDINASVKGVELAQLSAYSGKYAGYGIEKGKLSFDVTYQVENRQLTAQNRLVLDQLELGDEVDSPNATKLPVRLALALLKDRNGVIDINLPISGSLNDPQFSIGGIIVRAFVNLIVKAVTAPFSLLGAMFGGSEDLSWLEFDPGSRRLPDSGKAKLGSLSKALIDRPALNMDITGRFDPVADKEGLGRAGIQRKVRAMKRADMEKQGKAVAATEITVSPAEYPALLKRVYADEKFSKPRNLIGMQKSLPVEEMERLMIANYQVSEDDMVALANQRAQAVKGWLTTAGEVPAERIFILAGKSGAEHKSAKASRVDFSLR